MRGQFSPRIVPFLFYTSNTFFILRLQLHMPDKSIFFLQTVWKKSWSSYFERAVFLYKHYSINYYVSDQDMFTLAFHIKQCSKRSYSSKILNQTKLDSKETNNHHRYG